MVTLSKLSVNFAPFLLISRFIRKIPCQKSWAVHFLVVSPKIRWRRRWCHPSHWKCIIMMLSMKLSNPVMQSLLEKRFISRFQFLIYHLTSIIKLKNALHIRQTSQERFLSDLSHCGLSTATTSRLKETD